MFSLLMGVRSIQAGAEITFFQEKHKLITTGWGYITIAFLLGVSSFFVYQYAEPVISVIFKPSTSPTTFTITQTQTPTIEMAATMIPAVVITQAPTITKSALPMSYLSENIVSQFTAKMTPNPDTVFSTPLFAQVIENGRPINPSTVFISPVGHLYSTFSYDKMVVGSQWTTLWIRSADHAIICVDSRPWDGSTGGYDYSVCNPPAGQWLPGDYEIQIYTGTEFKLSASFTVNDIRQQ